MNIELLVTLLSVTVIIQSVVIVALLVLTTLILVKVHRISKRIDAVMGNIAQATQWLSPAKVLGQLAKMFRK